MPVYQVRSAHPPAAAGASASPAQAAVGHRGWAAPPPPASAVRFAGPLLVRVSRLRARAHARDRAGAGPPRERDALRTSPARSCPSSLVFGDSLSPQLQSEQLAARGRPSSVLHSE